MSSKRVGTANQRIQPTEAADARHSMQPMKLKRIAVAYAASWWIPSAFAFCMLIAFVLTCVLSSKHLVLLGNGMLILLGSSLLGILAASIWNFVKKRWGRGTVNLLMFPVSLVVTFIVGLLMFSVMFDSVFGPSEDGFADNLTIPDNIEIAEPLDWGEESRGGPEDAFQSRLLVALEKPGDEDPSITADLPSLAKLHKNAPDILKRYLATSPAWRVFREDDALFATRRWMIASHWRYHLGGYYTRRQFGPRSKSGLPDFQFRLTLGLSGKPRVRGSSDSTRMPLGERSRLTLSTGNQMHESHCVVLLDELVVEVFEQSEARERRLTKAALAHLEEELRPLAQAPQWSTIQRMLPSGSTREGEPTIELYGFYDSTIWANPGEPGMIYLKAYEVTHEHRLSADELNEYSNERVGWSSDPSQLFFSNTHFTIYEGDLGKPYAARFEVWFVPDSGAPERKMIEKVFKIVGWQR